MPDLSHQGVYEYWRAYPDPMIHRVIAFMEGVEDWTADGDPELENALAKLAATLDDLGNIELAEEEACVNICASLKTGRGLRLLMSLDAAYPGAAAKVLMYAEDNTESENDIPAIFLRRNIVFERLRLLGRVFSEERITLITQALEDSSYD